MRYAIAPLPGRASPRVATHVVSLLCVLVALVHGNASAAELRSPDGELTLHVALDAAGGPGFELRRGDEPVIGRSPLGVSLAGTAFVDGLRIVRASEPAPLTGDYRLWTGKRSTVSYRARQRDVTLQTADGQTMIVALRMFDDGFAYRYEFPGESAEEEVVVAEHGGIRFLPGTRAWLQPKANAQTGWSNTNPSYEEDYHQDIPVGTPSPTESGWVYPALFRYGEHWIVLTEAGMDGRYPGSNLARTSEDGLYRVRFPQEAEVVTGGGLLPAARRPFHSPWRLVVVGDLPTVMQSTLGTDLAEPAVLERTDFVEPGIAAWSWGLLKDDSVVYPVQTEFIDYAAWMEWPYVLVDADWDRNIGYAKVAELAEYAAGQGVGLFLWYNSSGAWNETVYSPKGRLLTRADRRTEFERLASMGIRGVKVDFFPGDGASAIRYYRDILQDAADFRLMVNFHGSTLPRGLHRTFPNMVTSEAVKGMEMVTFMQEVADRQATHVAMLPFTRNLFDPMDYTPMALGDIPNIERSTSNGFELALPALFTSGIQHLVTTPEQMRGVPQFVRDYLRELPGRWDESRFVDGYPGRFVVIARRADERWYVSGINALETRRFDLDLSFIEAERGVLIRDGEEPRQFRREEIEPGRHAIELAAGSGFVMSFGPPTGE